MEHRVEHQVLGPPNAMQIPRPPLTPTLQDGRPVQHGRMAMRNGQQVQPHHDLHAPERVSMNTPRPRNIRKLSALREIRIVPTPLEPMRMHTQPNLERVLMLVLTKVQRLDTNRDQRVRLDSTTALAPGMLLVLAALLLRPRKPISILGLIFASVGRRNLHSSNRRRNGGGLSGSLAGRVVTGESMQLLGGNGRGRGRITGKLRARAEQSTRPSLVLMDMIILRAVSRRMMIQKN